MLLKIGELARRTGLTVRTLHHYDAIGLLRPSARSSAGYRMYDRGDVARLHRIQALRRLDIPLAEVAALLDGGGAELETVIDQQIVALDRQLARAADLRGRLATLRDHIRAKEEPVLEDWLATLAMMNFYDRYFTPEELARLQRNGGGHDRGFAELREQLREAMDAGETPGSARVLSLAERWIALSVQQMGSDARLMHKVHQLHQQEPDVPFITGIDAALLDYITRATAEFRFSLYERHIGGAAVAQARAPFLRHYVEWPALFAEARELQEQGADPLDPAALDLARRWLALFIAIWGIDEGLHQQVLAVNAREPALMNGLGIDDAAVGLVRASIAHLRTQGKNTSHEKR
ncbi:MAG TPA: MerR family transcriptional regulator [Noviherbaspirillum sp.]|jgi:DNA-binding transcriptional MerR regulator|uniref:MerR family transcriptional regulator n=1 Tax=Noviherbaspirillum sp. TaxID=1926288 RepID=UPI002F934426